MPCGLAMTCEGMNGFMIETQDGGRKEKYLDEEMSKVSNEK
jgi:hypothetical protein